MIETGKGRSEENSAYYLVPFGRVARSGDRSEFVGREGERAFLIDALTSDGPRGSYLVTGRRGVGKSSFVDACVEEYEASVFKRFLRSTHGRSLLDRTAMVILAFLLIFALVISSDLLEQLAAALKQNTLLLLPIIPLLLLVLAPAAYGFQVLHVALTLLSPRAKWLGTFTLVAFIAIVAAALLLEPFGAPALSVSRLAIGIGLICFATSITKLSEPRGARRRYTVALLYYGLALIPAFFPELLVPLASFVGVASWIEMITTNGPNETLAAVIHNLTIAVALIISVRTSGKTTGHNLRKLFFRSADTGPNSPPVQPVTFYSHYSGSNFAFRAAGILFAFSLLFLIKIYLDDGVYKLNFEFGKIILVLIAPIAISSAIKHATSWGKPSEFRATSEDRPASPSRFKPPVQALMMVKATILIVASLQATYPIVNVAPQMLSRAVSVVMDSPCGVLHDCEPEQLAEESKQIINIRDTVAPANHMLSCFVEEGASPPENCRRVIKSASKAGSTQTEEIYLTLFNQQNEELAWISVLLIALATVFFLEYNWISRSLIAERQSSAMGLSPRRLEKAHTDLDPVWWRAVIQHKETENTYKAKQKVVRMERDFDALFGDRPQQMRISAMRRLEKATFPWLMVSMWMPAIVVRINLGFDSLDHRGVTHAMLVGLKEAYQAKFLEWRSPYGLLTNFAGIMFAVFAVSLLSEELVDFPDIDPDQALITPSDLQPDGFGGDMEYCGVLDKLATQRGGEMRARAPLARAACAAVPNLTNRTLPLLFVELLRIPMPRELLVPDGQAGHHLVFSFLHDNNGLPQVVTAGDGTERVQTIKSLSVRGYHIIAAVLVIWLIRLTMIRIALLPYRRTVLRIDSLLQALTSRTNETHKQGFSLSSLRFIFANEAQTNIEREQLDPRSVELALLAVLEDVQRSSIRFPGGGAGGRLTLPVPEVTFIFDELDKISGVLGGDQGGTTSMDDRAVLDAERRRTYALHQLMSDMKRVISSAPARFIFVGNRLMHDEWQADRGRRQPLLTSIFDAQIYLPNLLLDQSGATSATDLASRIREYVERRHAQAEIRYVEFSRQRRAELLGMSQIANEAPAFAEDAFRLPSKKSQLPDLFRQPLSTNPDDKRVCMPSRDKERFWDDFVRFLAFRSGGNPKKLTQLFAEFQRPAARYSNSNDTGRWNDLDCEDVLCFSARDLYRIQFIASLYRDLIERFEIKLIERDDKVIEAVLYLSDFVMKFHGRAFSWSSLERVEELGHIHRTPDLRDIMIEIVESSSERWLHRLLNGMYSFRFRSDLAIELRFLSQLDQSESAALNFTLDEAQGLKATYLGTLTSTSDEARRHSADLLGGLGELHEYDQEYDDARLRYQEAMEQLDRRFYDLVGETVPLFGADLEELNKALKEKKITLETYAEIFSSISERQTAPVMRAIMEQDKHGARAPGVFMPWGVKRLRLMLQIAMTFELAPDYERAKVHYLNARQFAWSLIEMYPAVPADHLLAGDASSFRLRKEKARIAASLDLLKHMNLLYQPLFAEAWVSEKLEGGIDTAGSLVEEQLLALRRRLPFLRSLHATRSAPLAKFALPVGRGQEGALNPSADATNNLLEMGGSGQSNFALIGAELHNKAGDLYFFKGRQQGAKKWPARITHSELDQIIQSEESRRQAADPLNFDNTQGDDSTDGLLLEAHYHYAVGLHELRRFITYRRHTSGNKFNPVRGGSQTAPWLVIGKGDWAAFIPQAIHNGMSDIAETSFARVSVLTVLAEAIGSGPDSTGCGVLIRGEKADVARHLDDFERIILDWFEATDDATFAHMPGERHPASATGSERVYRDPTTQAFFDHFRSTNAQGQAADDGAAQNARNILERKVSEFLGAWSYQQDTLPTEEVSPILVSFSGMGTSTERLITALMFLITGAKIEEDAGFNENAAREYLICLELIARFLKWMRITRELQHGLTNDPDGDWCKLASYLGHLAVTVASRHVDLTRRMGLSGSGGLISKPSAERFKTEGVTVSAKTVVLSVMDNLSNLLEPDSAPLHDMTKIAQDIIDARALADTANPLEAIDTLRRRRRFPILNQLLALKALVDGFALRVLSGALSDPNEIEIERAKTNANFRTLLKDSARLDASFHFTPGMIGESAALFAMALEKLGGDPDQTTELAAIAREKLIEARQMGSMGRSYYRSIAGLYYIYDDFNDRRIHANHAAQMAGLDLYGVLLARLDEIADYSRAAT